MSKIVRTKTRVEGGITPEEKKKMDAHAELWIARAMRTEPIEPDKIIPAIEGLYAAANLKKPRVVIVPSPMVMAFAYGAAAAIWYNRTNATDNATDSATRNATDNATDNATRIATRNATDNATDNATYSATDSATYSATYSATDIATDSATRNATDNATRIATRNATDNATDNATRIATRNATRNATYIATRNATYIATQACFDVSGELGLSCAKRWANAYQGGNMWAGLGSYLTAFRDILGLELPCHADFSHWEQAVIHGGFRVMHEEFCIVSDFPEVLKKDEENRPHCEDGPSHKWRDGWALYHWHGVKVPAEWIENKDTIDPVEILKTQNVEERAAGCQIVGWARMLDHLDHKIIDSDENEQHGDLIEITMEGLPEPEWYLRFYCPRNGLMMEGVNKRELMEPTVFAAQAWKSPIPDHLFSYPEQRS